MSVLRAAFLALGLSVPGTALAQDAVGRLNTAGFKSSQMCSGALIAPNLVLTAAHCVAAPEDGYLKRVADMVFVAGWNGGGHAGAAKVARVELHPNAFASGRFDLRHDVALVTLTTPLDIPPLAVGLGLPDGPLDLIGYPRSAPHRVRHSSDCAGLAFHGLWQIACAVEHGQSGGPVLTGDGAARRIVAVIVAISDKGTLAVPIGDWVRERRAALTQS